MGNIFYTLLTEYWPFEDIEEKEAQEQVINGYRPIFEGLVVSFSTNQTSSKDKKKEDSCIDALKVAMKMCWQQDASLRPSADEVTLYLKTQLKRIDPSLLSYKFR